MLTLLSILIPGCHQKAHYEGCSQARSRDRRSDSSQKFVQGLCRRQEGLEAQEDRCQEG